MHKPSCMQNYEYCWIVDPLDGTKEFIKRVPHFTVNVALVRGNAPIMGVVYTPAADTTHFAIKGCGAFVRCAPRRSHACRSCVALPPSKPPHALPALPGDTGPVSAGPACGQTLHARAFAQHSRRVACMLSCVCTRRQVKGRLAACAEP